MRSFSFIFLFLFIHFPKAREVRKKKTPPQKLIVRIEKKKKEKVLAEKFIVRKIKEIKNGPKKLIVFFLVVPGQYYSSTPKQR